MPPWCALPCSLGEHCQGKGAKSTARLHCMLHPADPAWSSFPASPSPAGLAEHVVYAGTCWKLIKPGARTLDLVDPDTGFVAWCALWMWRW